MGPMPHRGRMGIRGKVVLLCTLLVPVLAWADDEAAALDDAALENVGVATIAMSVEDTAIVGVGTASVPGGYVNKKDPWIDRAHQGMFNAVWRSAMRMDSWFGGTSDEAAYM